MFMRLVGRLSVGACLAVLATGLLPGAAHAAPSAA